MSPNRAAPLTIALALAGVMLAAAPHPATAACTDPPRPAVDWRSCNFDKFELSNIDMSGAKLDRASFNRAVMKGTAFTGIDGARTRFLNADLRETSFAGASLRYTDFTDADLRDATFEGADLADARFVAADLRGANLTGARIRGSNFYRADLSGATWVDGAQICAENSISFCR